MLLLVIRARLPVWPFRRDPSIPNTERELPEKSLLVIEQRIEAISSFGFLYHFQGYKRNGVLVFVSVFSVICLSLSRGASCTRVLTRILHVSICYHDLFFPLKDALCLVGAFA